MCRFGSPRMRPSRPCPRPRQTLTGAVSDTRGPAARPCPNPAREGPRRRPSPRSKAGGALADHLGHLRRRNRLAPVGQLHDRPDPRPLSRPALDREVSTQPRDLPPDPGGVGGVTEPGMIRHRAEDVEVLRLGSQIDRQLGTQRPAAGPPTTDSGTSPAAPRRTSSRIARNWRTQSVNSPHRQLTHSSRCGPSSERASSGVGRSGRSTPISRGTGPSSGRRSTCRAEPARPAPSSRGRDDNRARCRQPRNRRGPAGTPPSAPR